jgi:hypothetical protein
VSRRQKYFLNIVVANPAVNRLELLDVRKVLDIG